MICTAFSHAKPPRNIHAAREVTILILKITRDELPMEQGVYGGCLLCPLYPLLNLTYYELIPNAITYLNQNILDSLFSTKNSVAWEVKGEN